MDDHRIHRKPELVLDQERGRSGRFPGKYSPADHRYWEIIFDEKSSLGQHMQDVCLKSWEIKYFVQQRFYIKHVVEDTEKVKQRIKNPPGTATNTLKIINEKTTVGINSILEYHSPLKRFSWLREGADAIIDAGNKMGNIYRCEKKGCWKLTLGRDRPSTILARLSSDYTSREFWADVYAEIPTVDGESDVASRSSVVVAANFEKSLTNKNARDGDPSAAPVADAAVQTAIDAGTLIPINPWSDPDDQQLRLRMPTSQKASDKMIERVFKIEGLTTESSIGVFCRRFLRTNTDDMDLEKEDYEYPRAPVADIWAAYKHLCDINNIEAKPEYAGAKQEIQNGIGVKKKSARWLETDNQRTQCFVGAKLTTGGRLLADNW